MLVRDSSLILSCRRVGREKNSCEWTESAEGVPEWLRIQKFSNLYALENNKFQRTESFTPLSISVRIYFLTLTLRRVALLDCLCTQSFTPCMSLYVGKVSPHIALCTQSFISGLSVNAEFHSMSLYVCKVSHVRRVLVHDFLCTQSYAKLNV